MAAAALAGLRSRGLACLLLPLWLALLGAQPASAEADPRLLGDAFGVRGALERAGVSVQLYYTQYGSALLSGGADPHEAGHNGSYDWLTYVELDELLGLRGLTGLLHVRGLYDRNLNREVGSLGNPIDDADFDEAIFPDQLWLEQALAGDRVRVRAGLVEQQSIFDRNRYADSEDVQFMNAFFDNNPIVPLPDALSVIVLVRPVRRLALAASVADADNAPRQAGFDSAFDGLDSLSAYLEAALDVSLPGPRGALPGRIRVGVFRDGRARPRLGAGGGSVKRGRPGVYLNLEQALFAEDDPAQGLGAFVRAGWTDGDFAPLEWFASGGLSYRGPLPGRDLDELGLALYQAIGSSRAPISNETGVEAYYRIELLPWLAVTPDLQWIRNPGGRGAHRDAWVASLRFRVAF